MKHFRRFRDDRFALTTLQNPLCEVRTRAELIQAAQQALGHQPQVTEIPPTPPVAAPQRPPEAITAPKASSALATSPPVAAQRPPEAVTVPKAPSAPSTAALAPQNPPAAPASLDRTPQPPKPHTSEIGLSLREPVRKVATPQPPAPHNAKTSLSLREPVRKVATPQPSAPHTAKTSLSLREPIRKAPAPKPRRKLKRYTTPRRQPAVVPSGDAAEYVAKVLDGHVTKASIARRDDSDPISLDHHARKCVICNHPDRADLEEDFVSWRNVELIQKDYELPNFRAVYRHARATGLYQRRRENLRFAAELLIEHADQAEPSPEAILRAIQICARLNGSGEWVEPVKRVIFSSGGNISAPEPEHQFEPQRDPTSRREPVLQQLTSESAAHPQLSAPVGASADRPNPQTLIDTNGD